MMNIRLLALILVAISVLLIVTIVIAAPDVFILDWWTVDGGGGTSQGGGYQLTGTIGQHDVGYLTSEQYQLSGGFWEGKESSYMSYLIYLPIIVR